MLKKSSQPRAHPCSRHLVLHGWSPQNTVSNHPYQSSHIGPATQRMDTELGISKTKHCLEQCEGSDTWETGGRTYKLISSIRTLSLWGTGARRMFEWIEQWRTSGLSLKTNWALLERRQVVLTAEVLIL